MRGWFDVLWARLASGDDRMAEDLHRRSLAEAPLLWLLGKTGAGKTSIVAALTGDPRAAIGVGYKPCTRQSQIYDWPDEAPVLRFMDTRGLGEAEYDPAEDCAFAAGQSHILLVVMKIDDRKQQAILAQVKAIRRQRPDWPVLVAQTGLHRLYPTGADHPASYPYRGTDADDSLLDLPSELRLALREMRAAFADVPGVAPIFVPLDFTLPEDGYTPADYGLDALYEALKQVGLSFWHGQARAGYDRIGARAHGVIAGYAAAAGVSGALPFPVAGIGGLASILALMLRALAGRYDVEWDRARLMQFAGAIGFGTGAAFAVQYGVREAIKLIPGPGTVLGGALNAAASSALVYGIGRAAVVYLSDLQAGRSFDAKAVRDAFAEAFHAARQRKKPS